jgi:small conductance mechanosensitive channel
MLKRILLFLFVAACPVLALAQQATTAPTSAPASQPTLHVHVRASAADSSGINVTWFDTTGGVLYYRVDRSSDGGKSWTIIGGLPGNGSANGIGKYTLPQPDQDGIQPQTQYEYRVGNTFGAVLSPIATVTTPSKNLLEAVDGKTTVTLHDVLQPTFWTGGVSVLILRLIQFIPRLVLSIFLFLIFYVIYRVLRQLAIRSMQRAAVDPSVYEMLVTLLRLAVLGFGLVISCDQIGINIATLLAGVSIIGLAIGFAAQDTLSNMISCIIIFLDKPFKVGDWVTVSGHYGRIARITFRSTRFIDTDGSLIVVPNTVIMGGQIVNHTTIRDNRLSVPITLAASKPIDRVRAALVATTSGDDRLATDHAPEVIVDSFTTDTVSYCLHLWVRDESLEKVVLHDYLERAKKALDAAGL